MHIFTIGFTKKSARSFFEMIKLHDIEALIDVRLNNSSQLAGFSKGNDLEYFLETICVCKYSHEITFAPTKELMANSKSRKLSMEEFEKQYSQLIERRDALNYFVERYSKMNNICLLCSEDTPDNCHRRVLADLVIKRIPEASLRHL